MTDPLAPDPYAPSPPAGAGDERTLPIVVYVLYLLGFITGGLSAVAGVVTAYVVRGGAGVRARSHYEFQIRTFWIALACGAATTALALISLPLVFVLIGIPMLLLAKLLFVVIAVWFAVRSVLGLLAATRDAAYPRPRAWLA